MSITSIIQSTQYKPSFTANNHSTSSEIKQHPLFGSSEKPSGLQGLVDVFSAKNNLRELEADELQKLAKQETHWLPAIFTSLGTPLYKRVSSAVKWGLLMGGTGSGAASLMSAAHGFTPPAIAALGAGSFLLLGKLGQLYRKSMNDEAKYLMRRLPKWACEGDAQALPVYRAQVNRNAMTWANRENNVVSSLQLHQLVKNLREPSAK